MFSAALLLLALPLFALVALAIKLDSPGPVFYRARRVGYRGRALYMLKFRKMRADAAGSALTADDDQRFTRVGAVLCKTKLDELPQLWNVLRGQMSLIGPRPEDPRFVDRHPDAFELILTVRPGITGYSQIAFAEENRILDDDHPVSHYIHRILPQKVRLDVLYATQHCGPRRDTSIALWTLVAVLGRREVAVNRRTGHLGLRSRRDGSSAIRSMPAELDPSAGGSVASLEASAAEASAVQSSAASSR